MAIGQFLVPQVRGRVAGQASLVADSQVFRVACRQAGQLLGLSINPFFRIFSRMLAALSVV